MMHFDKNDPMQKPKNIILFPLLLMLSPILFGVVMLLYLAAVYFSPFGCYPRNEIFFEKCLIKNVGQPPSLREVDAYLKDKRYSVRNVVVSESNEGISIIYDQAFYYSPIVILSLATTSEPLSIRIGKGSPIFFAK